MSILHIAQRRSTILDYLRDGPLDKRDLLDRVAASRSTIDRAIEELIDHEMVREVSGGYEATLVGVLALERAREAERDADAIATTAPALTPLWKESDVAVEFLRGADVSLVAAAEGMRLLAALGSAIRTADEIRAVFPQIARPEQLETLYARASDGRETEIVVSGSLFETLSSTFPGWLRAVALGEHGSVSVGTVPEYALVVCRAGDEREAFLLTYDDGRLHAVLRNDGAAAAWADERFSTVRDAANDRREEVRELDAEARFGGVGDATPPFGETSAVATDHDEADGPADDLLASGYAVDGGKLRTPAYGTEEACTVAFWMRPADLAGGWQVLLKWDYLVVALRRGELHGNVYDAENAEQRAFTAVPLAEIEENRWQHVAYTYDESVARLYLDGELVDETEDDYPLRVDELGAALGYHYRDRDTGVHDPTYDGRLYDARLYGAALSPAAIERLVATTDPTAVAWGGD
ncbi:LamG domain-containing protein [Halolamina rubra]|uniref:LamG domain-containing protein n=1 Tax=Halolamina rubra TaxID=1380430 RepID=UPI00067907A2|nr:LamG domain-containing protein [Halolamina rubra]